MEKFSNRDIIVYVLGEPLLSVFRPCCGFVALVPVKYSGCLFPADIELLFG